MLCSTSITLASDGSENGTIVSADFDPNCMVPAGTDLVAEIAYGPDNRLWPGSNPLGQTCTGYIAADDCGLFDLTDLAAIGFPDMHLVFSLDLKVEGGCIDEFPKGGNCIPDDCEIACCDKETGDCIDFVGKPEDCPEGDQVQIFSPATCETIECERHTGACCDGTTGTCVDGTFPEDCTGDQVVWIKDTLCIDVVCVEHTGACCNAAAPGGSCQNDVPESQCPVDSQHTWTKDASCSQVVCNEHTGACCNAAAPGGDCQDDVPESQCPVDSQHTWTKGASCGQVACDEHTGACCNHAAPGGSCENGVPESQCDTSDPQVDWTKDASCSSVGCFEHTGACCLDGECTDGVAESDCLGSEAGSIKWQKDTPCDDPDFSVACAENAIPTVSQWGMVVLAVLLLIGVTMKVRRNRPVTA